MSEPSAKIILDSVSMDGHRLTTMECVMHRFVLAEFNTHRVFSRNSASSRAIPVKKQIQRVLDDPAIPLVWPAEKSGMQGGESLDDERSLEAEIQWRLARNVSVESARILSALGVHKSVTNRLLEPFMWHTVIVTSTDWANFFGLRCNPMAQPEIQAVAYAMRDAYRASEPQSVGDHGWHTPYVDDLEASKLLRVETSFDAGIRRVCLISAARCARVSYLTHDGKHDPAADIGLAERLISASPPHASPLEHVATPDKTRSAPGNFDGWAQFRHLVTA